MATNKFTYLFIYLPYY